MNFRLDNWMMHCHHTREWVLAMAVGLCVFAGIGKGADITVPLEWREIEHPASLHSGIRVGIKRINPTNSFAIPPSKSGKPCIYELTYGHRVHHFLADTAETNTPYYDRIWYDRDGDRDFADETPVAANNGKYASWLLSARAPVTLDMTVFGKPALEFIVEVAGPSLTDPPDREYYRISRFWFKHALSGTINVGGSPYRIDLFDTSADGALDAADCMRLFPLGEQPASPPSPRRLSLPKYLVLGSRTFRLDVDPKGRFCTLRDIPVKGTGLLALSPDVFFAKLTSEDGMVLVQDPEGDVRLPASSYRTGRFYSSMRRMKNGKPWIFQQQHHTDFNIVAGEKHEMDIGSEPFSICCGNVRRKKEAWRPDITIRDGKGRRITTDIFAFPKPPKPTYRLSNPSGEVVKHGTLGYG